MGNSSIELVLKSIFLTTLCLLPLFLACADGAPMVKFAQPMGLKVDSLVGDLACKMVNCGKGTCNGSADDKPPFYFDCECEPGWTKIKIGDITLPPCMVPNCTIDLGCGASSSPPPPAPLLPPLLPPVNFSDPCNFTWCGEGTCKISSGGVFPVPTCICNEGALNLMNLTDLPCLKQCSIGADCLNLGLGPPSPPLPSPQGPVPSGGSPSKGGDGGSSSKSDVKWFQGSIVLMVLSIGLQLIV